MKNVLKLEYLTFLIFGIYLFTTTSYEYWWLFVFFLAPDISMLGYLFGNKVGAVSYNIFHHFATGFLLLLISKFLQEDWLFAAGAIVIAHAAFDRVLGYGLKHFDGFHHTHLGVIGKKKE